MTKSKNDSSRDEANNKDVHSGGNVWDGKVRVMVSSCQGERKRYTNAIIACQVESGERGHIVADKRDRRSMNNTYDLSRSRKSVGIRTNVMM